MTTSAGDTSPIRGTKVIGTTVKDPAGQTIGTVTDVILDKTSNSIMFAVISFGGFLGIGEKYHPIPWGELDYVPQNEAYIVNYTRQQLEAAPHDTIEELTRDNGILTRERTYDYYGVARYWQ
jgi:uncharacterized protein YrrD